MPHYQVINITQKPGVKKGPHRQGFFVDLGDKRLIAPNRSHTVENVTPGMMHMQKKGFISIERIEDIEVVIANQIQQNAALQKAEHEKAVENIVKEKEEALTKAKEEAESVKKVLTADPTQASGLDKEDMREKVLNTMSQKPSAKVSMGDGEDPMSDIEEAINPDGEPNFTVKVDPKKMRRNR